MSTHIAAETFRKLCSFLVGGIKSETCIRHALSLYYKAYNYPIVASSIQRIMMYTLVRAEQALTQYSFILDT